MRRFNGLGTILVGLTLLFSRIESYEYGFEGYSLCPDQFCYDPVGLFVSAEMLYWTVYQSELDYAIDDSTSSYIAGPGDIHFIDYDWNFGFRAMMGYRGGCNGWSLRAVYTGYCNTGKDKKTAKEGFTLSSSLVHPDTTPTQFSTIEAKNSLRYQTVDVLIVRSMPLICGTFEVHPFIGARGLVLDQSLKGTHIDEPDEEVLSDEIIVRLDSDFCAGGLIGGFDYVHPLCRGFGLYGNIAGSLCAGPSEAHIKQTEVEIADDEDQTRTISPQVDLEDDQRIIIPGCQMGLGIYWEKCCGNKYYYVIKGGYEFSTWWQAYHLRRQIRVDRGCSIDALTSSVGLHGGTLRFELYF